MLCSLQVYQLVHLFNLFSYEAQNCFGEITAAVIYNIFRVAVEYIFRHHAY